jgi:hypothetical protein
MFIGHFGLGMAVKKAAPGLSFGTLFMAVQFVDLIWPTLLILNLEQVEIHPELGGNKVLEFTNYPITHSLLMGIVWGVLFGSVYFLIKKNLKNSIIAGLCVLSHWFVDLIVHFHDLPLFPWDSPKVGLGLWESVPGTLVLESLITITGLTIYLRQTKAVNKKGSIVFWVLIGLLVLVQISSLIGPPPGSVQELAWSAQFQWLFVALAYWADANRTAVPTSDSVPSAKPV